MIGLKPVGIETAGKAIKHSLPCLDLEDPLRDRLRMNWRLVCLCAVKKFALLAFLRLEMGAFLGSAKIQAISCAGAIFSSAFSNRPSLSL